LLDEFKRATGQNLKDHFDFENDEILQFLKAKPGMFQIEGNVIRPKEYRESQEFTVKPKCAPKRKGNEEDSTRDIIILD
jgi:hypothetical protein